MTALNAAQTALSTVVVRAGRDLDIYSAPEFRERLWQAVRTGAGAVVVDLDRTEVVDYTGLGVIVGAFRRAPVDGAGLRSCAPANRSCGCFRRPG